MHSICDADCCGLTSAELDLTAEWCGLYRCAIVVLYLCSMLVVEPTLYPGPLLRNHRNRGTCVDVHGYICSCRAHITNTRSYCVCACCVVQTHGLTVLVLVVWYKRIAYVSSHKSFIGWDVSVELPPHWMFTVRCRRTHCTGVYIHDALREGPRHLPG